MRNLIKNDRAAFRKIIKTYIDETVSKRGCIWQHPPYKPLHLFGEYDVLFKACGVNEKTLKENCHNGLKPLFNVVGNQKMVGLNQDYAY